MRIISIASAVVLQFLVTAVETSNLSKNLSDILFKDYDSGLRPICENVTLVNLTIGIAVRQIISLDEPNQELKVNLWMRLKWNDCLLKWDPNDFGGKESIIVPIKRIWMPDLTLYDSTSMEFPGIKDYRAHVFSDGTVNYNFPSVLQALCPIDVANFPFDTQICELIFGSWNHHGLDIDIYPNPNPGDVSNMKPNVEWIIPKVETKRHTIVYICCPAPYPDVTFYIHLQRKPAYYVTNILIPSIMITILTVLGYFLPVDSGEKVSLVITVMLAMSVFQLLVADKLPPSADATPWIMFFFNFILGLSAVSTIVQVIVINIYYRGERVMSRWMKDYLVGPLCYVTQVTLPGNKTWISSLCGKKVHAKDEAVFTKEPRDPVYTTEPRNTVLWQSFSVAIDRIGIVLFTITLIIGVGFVLNKMMNKTV